ncbi:MAG: hypothetical protein RLZZ107_1926 [Bacteroidota bacterium]
MKKLITLSIIAMLFIGCGKINTPNSESEKIFGKWRFVSSSGGFAGTGNTSYSSNDLYEYKENGTFSHYEGNQLIDQSSFSLQLGTSITGQTNQLMIHYGVVGYQQSFQINNDTLFLSDEVYDGFQYVFVKQ